MRYFFAHGVLAAALALPFSATAQVCTQQMDETPPTLSHDAMGWTGFAFQCFESENYFHFVGSRGAFSDAQWVEPRWTTDPFLSTCPMTDPGGNPIDGCLKATIDCGSRGSGPVCTDSLLQSGEMTCSCHPRKTVKITNVPRDPPPLLPPPGIGHGFNSALYIDEDLDGRAERWAKAHQIGNQSVEPVHVRPVSRGVWRFEWEDLFPSDKADFNDYVSMYELRECRPTRWPLDTVPATTPAWETAEKRSFPSPAGASTAPWGP